MGLNQNKSSSQTKYNPEAMLLPDEDPLEENNIIEKYPEKAEELNAYLMKHIQKSGAVPWQNQPINNL